MTSRNHRLRCDARAQVLKLESPVISVVEPDHGVTGATYQQTGETETVHPLHPPLRAFPCRVSLHSCEDKVASHTQQNLSEALG
jgi:hypothetical protein